VKGFFFFSDRVLRTICLAGFRWLIILISASWEPPVPS
jgi:hypothetical protein